MKTETWKVIPSHPAYLVSDIGNVQRVKRVTNPRPIATRRDHNGYMRADLWTNGRRRARVIHQLVLEAFVGPMPPNTHGRHLDGNKLNNSVGNLAWGSPAENADDRIKHALASVGLADKVLYARARLEMARAMLENGVSPKDVRKGLGYTSLREMGMGLAHGYYRGQKRKPRAKK